MWGWEKKTEQILKQDLNGIRRSQLRPIKLTWTVMDFSGVPECLFYKVSDKRFLPHETALDNHQLVQHAVPFL